MNKQELIGKYEDKLKDVQLKFGANFKTKVYDGLVKDLKQLDEPQKVTVPQFVAEYIKKTKNYHWDLHEAMQWVELEDCKELKEYFYIAKNIETFARAWLDGYTVKGKRYRVRFKGLDKDLEYLNFKHGHVWVFSDNIENEEYRTAHTRKELEEAGFGWVFDCEGVEVEEVEG